MADQLLTMNADIVGFQEIFERPALYNVVKEANKRGAASNADVIPSKNKRYHRKAIFKKLAYEKYGNDTLFFAPNIFDGIPGNHRYSEEQNAQIQEAINSMRLTSAEKLFVQKSLRDMVYTSAFGGVYESIDQILMSRHFNPENPNAIGSMEYFSVLNDHITDGSHPEAPYNKLASNHGQIMA